MNSQQKPLSTSILRDLNIYETEELSVKLTGKGYLLALQGLFMSGKDDFSILGHINLASCSNILVYTVYEYVQYEYNNNEICFLKVLV